MGLGDDVDRYRFDRRDRGVETSRPVGRCGLLSCRVHLCATDRCDSVDAPDSGSRPPGKHLGNPDGSRRRIPVVVYLWAVKICRFLLWPFGEVPSLGNRPPPRLRRLCPAAGRGRMVWGIRRRRESRCIGRRWVRLGPADVPWCGQRAHGEAVVGMHAFRVVPETNSSHYSIVNPTDYGCDRTRSELGRRIRGGCGGSAVSSRFARVPADP